MSQGPVVHTVALPSGAQDGVLHRQVLTQARITSDIRNALLNEGSPGHQRGRSVSEKATHKIITNVLIMLTEGRALRKGDFS